jgi:hypothetical protein
MPPRDDGKYGPIPVSLPALSSPIEGEGIKTWMPAYAGMTKES